MRLKILQITLVVFSLLDHHVGLSQSTFPLFGPNGVAPVASSSFRDAASEEVNLHTGAVNVNVPLYQVEGRTLSLPVSLSYSTSGIKVGDRAGWVGLGWELNAGGYIAVEQKGAPDSPFGYTQHITTDASNAFDNRVSDLTTSRNDYAQHWTLSRGYVDGAMIEAADYIRRSTMAAIYAGAVDVEPDMYHFSFGNYSGKFVFDSYGVPHLIPHQNLFITQNVQGGITIQTTEGTQYIFNVTEMAMPRNVVSKYYLSQVVSASGNDVINLNYTSQGKSINETHVQRRYDYLGQTGVMDGNALFNQRMSPHIGSLASDPTVDIAVGSVQDIVSYDSIMDTKRLSSITSAKCTLSFSPGGFRTDILGDTYLSSIQVSDYRGNPITKFAFSYSYSDAGCLIYCQRLLLNALTESANGVSKPPYVFSYINSVGSTTVSLPSLFSYQQDLWGYFNGASANTHLVPSTTSNSALFGTQTFAGANRAVNASYAQIGLMNKIIYPMGGFTSFTYEGNSYYDPVSHSNQPAGGLRLLQRQDNDDNGTIITKNYAYLLQEDAAKSSGSIDQVPVYYNQLKVNVPDHYDVTTLASSISLVQNPGDYYFVETYSNPVVEYGTSQGSPVGYSCVKVTESGKGITMYQFSSFLDAYGNHPDIANTVVNDCEQSYYMDRAPVDAPYVLSHQAAAGAGTCWLPKTSREAERGLLMSVSYYNEGGVIQKQVSNIYAFVEVPHRDYNGDNDSILRVPAVRANINYNLYSCNTTYNIPRGLLCIPNLDVVAPNGSRPNFGYAGLFYYLSEWVQLTSTIEKTYDQVTGTNAIADTVTYEYSPGNMMVNKVTRTNGDGTKTVTALTYPFDYAYPTNSYIQPLVFKYLFGLVIEKVVYKVTSSGTASILSGQLNEYTPTGLLKSVYALENTSSVPIPMASFKFSNNSAGLLPPSPNQVLFDYWWLSWYKWLSQVNGSTIQASEFPQQPYLPDPKYVKKMTYLYDQYDHLIQSTAILNGTINGPSTSYLWGHSATCLLAKVANATADRVAYTSFETLEGSWSNQHGNGIISTGGKTGPGYYKYSQPINFSPATFPLGSYKLSFWANYQGSSPNPSVQVQPYSNGTTILFPIRGTGWAYYDTTIVNPIGSIWVNPSFSNNSTLESVGIDELRLCPADAQMETYSYVNMFDTLPLVGSSSYCDANGKVTYYEYDKLNRLTVTRDQDRHVLKRTTYGYKH